MKQKKGNKANTIILVLIFVGVFLYNVVNPREMVTIQVEDTALILGGYEDITYEIPLDAINELSYVEEAEYPEESKSILHGTYSNERWGEYILCVNGKVPACIVMETERGIYVFNYDNENTTKALYEALLELLL